MTRATTAPSTAASARTPTSGRLWTPSTQPGSAWCSTAYSTTSGAASGPSATYRKSAGDSPYRDWFNLSFDGNSNYNDGFWYEGWEGHYELVKLNLRNPAVADYILDTVKFWAGEFGIDGLRLDVAYCLDLDFLARLRGFCDSLRPDFFLVGETLHGDYNRWLASLHSVTNYECYKGLYSSLNDLNLFEIGHSIKRQSGSEPWALYRGRKLFNFLDNHDVTRIASILRDKRELPVAYGLLMAMPGIPCVYYGSEWGLEGEKKDGDRSLRPALEGPESNELTELVAALIAGAQ